MVSNLKKIKQLLMCNLLTPKILFRILNRPDIKKFETPQVCYFCKKGSAVGFEIELTNLDSTLSFCCKACFEQDRTSTKEIENYF